MTNKNLATAKLNERKYTREVAVAQWAELLLPTAEVHSSNPVMCKFLYNIHLLLAVERTKIKKKEAWIVTLKPKVGDELKLFFIFSRFERCCIPGCRHLSKSAVLTFQKNVRDLGK